MGHLVQAAAQLISEIEALGGKAEVIDDTDGLGFDRSIRLTPAEAKKYGDAIEAISDPRIAEVVKSSHGVRVTFVPDTRADFRDTFDLAAAVAVLDED